ncbi:MAG: hypothetical protein ACYTAF_07415 [Planctomycetota bacterium]|jgi:hypothetical protein
MPKTISFLLFLSILICAGCARVEQPDGERVEQETIAQQAAAHRDVLIRRVAGSWNGDYLCSVPRAHGEREHFLLGTALWNAKTLGGHPGVRRMVQASVDGAGNYLAALSSDRGILELDIIDLRIFAAEGEIAILQTIDAHPGDLRIEGWEDGLLIVESDALLTYDGELWGLELSQRETFALDPETGAFTARSPALQDPVAYYCRQLAPERDPFDRALAALALEKLGSAAALPSLRSALEQEEAADLCAVFAHAIEVLSK